MKNLLFFALVAVVMIVSCKKEEKEGKPGAKYALNFSIDNSDLKNDHISGDSPVEKLYYCVFTPEGRFIKQTLYTSSMPRFGTVEDSLEAGSYAICFFEGDQSLWATDSTFSADSHLFYKRIDLQVPGSTVVQNVTLKRITAQLVVNLEDRIPEQGVTLIKATVTDKWFCSIFNHAEPAVNEQDRTISRYLFSEDLGTKDLKISMPVRNTISPFTVTLSAWNSSVLVSEKVIQNVTAKQNAVTLLSGSLLSSVSSGFSVGFQHFDTDSIKVQL